MIDFSTQTYKNILSAMLALVPDSYDKRDTSPIQTALGPAAYALEEFYLNLNSVQQGAFVQTAAGNDLDQLALIGGITRYSASAAVRLGTFNVAVPIGSRFSTINGENSINFVVTSVYSAPDTSYYYELTAETPGAIGNDYSGAILPISVIPGLTSATITTILVLGDDQETDDELRARLITALTDRPFGGNIASYRDAVLAIDGVGAVQVYPTWNGGGTVKLSILGTDLLPASATVVSNVQEAIDPTVNQGQGIGLAPIGSTVTVVAPDSIDIDITATLTLAAGYSLSQVTPLVEAALEAYLASVRESWSVIVGSYTVVYEADVYYNRIISAILSAEGVVNVSGLTVNGGTSDIMLTETGTTQEVPVLGTVTLNE